ncbi:MAG: LPS export ABC transporter periplasmic protein LptC [Chitinophagales bacterium]|mgnify:FL=1|jgi:LPS export ABC transporter protein LptC|nr:LPS export ABC transporter periplasmic protein LptC [Chitinophagales bacterium]|tara:strand:- start:2716 stop:3303 length:588 start_codon:yes stop_codon:yes gene_type:complete
MLRHFIHTNNPFSTAWKRIVLFSFILLAACSNDLKKVKEISSEFLSVERGKEVEILFTEDGLPTIRIIAPTAVRYNTEPPDLPYTVFPDGLKLYVYNENGDLDSELSANEGKMTDNSDDLEVNGDVVIINEKGEQLNTENLTWNKEDKKIRSAGFVKIFTNDEIIYGSGFEADENFTNYVIYNITGTVKVKDESL